jgi:hypothetical protein
MGANLSKKSEHPQVRTALPEARSAPEGASLL